jgi:hypothetical protein
LPKNDIDETREKIQDHIHVIKERINQLGDEDVMTYRHDEEIKNSIEKICELYMKIYEECEHFNKWSDPSCRLLKDEPEILKRLELTEEELCPLRAQKK